MKEFLRILFACDLHNSRRTFLKFLNACKIYRVDVAIISGDLTGKFIVPIIEQANNTFSVNDRGRVYTINTVEELEKIKDNTLTRGGYPVQFTKKEFDELVNDESKFHECFLRCQIAQIEDWIRVIENRLKDTGILFFLSGGNDDPYEIESVTEKSDFVKHPEGRVVEIGEYEMMTLGYSNITPWHCPRDITEEEFAEKIKALASKVRNMKKTIFNIHCPPYASGLDTAQALDENLKPIIKYGNYVFVPVGSTAVHEAIEKYQPMLGLHGHIHESGGVCKINSTLCINPGSEYSEGTLRAVIINLDKGGKGVKSYIPVSP